ncbi:MAG: aldehyde dehydrogenase family protein [Candidatus Hinthialibacter antarcticus]|nr:aldehyde dehydrogenase family protein [Candidatus Hinthialibacter antarcticus]
MLKETYPYYLAGKPESPNADLEVADKFTGETVTRVARANADVIRQAIDAAQTAAKPMREMAAYERREILLHCAKRFEERAEELSQSLCIEAGKPIQHSRGETQRLIDTFQIAAEEAVRINGEVTPLDRIPRAKGYTGFTQRVPIGPCSFITPFNFPLNLAAHKIAPALAIGCPFVLKPASYTPLGALIIAETLAETDLPPGAFSVLPCKASDAGPLVDDDRMKLLSFTGSAEVGWSLKQKAGKKHVVLELGGNAGCIVDKDADIEDAVQRIAFGGFYQSGQSCISVQRVYIHQSIYEAFKAAFIEKAQSLKAGKPQDEETFIGPVISQQDAERIESWIQSAIASGANRLCGGQREGSIVEATVLDNVPTNESVYCDEVFGPVVCIEPFDEFGNAIAKMNESRFGLQAGVFTRDIHNAMKAWNQLEVGGVMVNESPSWRADQMPYGGVKDSGFGREGIRNSIEDMSELRLMVLRSA